MQNIPSLIPIDFLIIKFIFYSPAIISNSKLHLYGAIILYVFEIAQSPINNFYINRTELY